MEQGSKYVFLIFFLTTIKITITVNKDETKNKNDTGYYRFSNICDIKDRRSKVHCYCDVPFFKSAKTADCWVFTGGIKEDDPLWPSFSSQSQIEDLTFNVRSDNALTFIPVKAIMRLNKLKEISIQFGTILKIPSYAFANSSILKSIELKSNKITELQIHSFSQLMMLSNLSLEDNEISELNKNVFFELPNLHVLNLSHNNITLLHEGCFKQLHNLLELHINNNFISIITREMLEGLENLAVMNLRNNKLTMVGNLAFSELWRLKELLLDDNLIEFISNKAFGGLLHLQKLTLSGNRLKNVNDDLFEDLVNLRQLILSNNLLETISFDTFKPVIESDAEFSAAVYLDGNPLSCNCHLNWIYVLKNETKYAALRDALENISCIIGDTNDRNITNNDEGVSDDSYDYYEKNNGMTEKEIRKNFVLKKLSDIPFHNLPCPVEAKQSIETSYRHPVQNEIRLKAFSSVNQIRISSLFIFISIVLLS